MLGRREIKSEIEREIDRKRRKREQAREKERRLNWECMNEDSMNLVKANGALMYSPNVWYTKCSDIIFYMNSVFAIVADAKGP